MTLPYDKIYEQLWIIAAELGAAKMTGTPPTFSLKVAEAVDEAGKRKAAVAERLDALSDDDAVALNGKVLECKFECLVFDIGLGDADFLGVEREPNRFGLGTKGLVLRTEIEAVKQILEEKGKYRPSPLAVGQLHVADDRIRARFGMFKSGAKHITPANAAWLAERAKSAPAAWWWYHLPVLS